MTTSTPEDAPMLLPHALAARVLRSASVTNAGFFQGTGVVNGNVVNSGIVAPRKGGGDRRQGGRSKIRRKSDGDYRLGGVPWPNIENQGLVFFCCALDVKDHFKGNVRAPRGERCDPKHVPQPAFNVLVGVFLRDRLIAAIRSLVAATGQRKLASAAVGVTSISARRDKFRGIAVCVYGIFGAPFSNHVPHYRSGFNVEILLECARPELASLKPEQFKSFCWARWLAFAGTRSTSSHGLRSASMRA
jgi:hypothetical protein